MADKTVRVTTDLKKLNQLVATFAEANGLAVKVGILADHNARAGSGKDVTNAGIGLVHEFGSYIKHIPERSFIRMPLRKKQGEIVKEIQNRIGDHLFQGIKPFLQTVGHIAEGVIEDAFATGGFGSWAPIAPATEKRKKSDAILIDQGFLRSSIMSKVVKVGE